MRPALPWRDRVGSTLPVLRLSGVGRREAPPARPWYTKHRRDGLAADRRPLGWEQGFAWLQTPVWAPAAGGAGKSDRP